MVRTEIKGLSFPLGIGSVGTFKTALLYFDKIALIDPYLGSCEWSTGFDDLIADIHTLIKEQIVELIDPAKVFSRFGNEIMDGVIQDLHDPDYLSLCEPFIYSQWVLESGKLPNNHADKWLQYLLENIPKLACQSIVHNIRNQYLRHFDERKMYFYGGVERELDKEISHLFKEIFYDERRVLMLPFPVGESILVGHALAAVAHGEFIPFCNDRTHLDVLKVKIRRHSNNRAFKAVLHEYGYLKDVKESILAQDVLTETVPSLEQVPIKTLLRFREEKADELENFRIEMRKLVTEIESDPWDSDFENHIRDIIDSRVNPALKDLENEIRGCKDSFWADAVKTFAKVSPLPIVGSIFSGIPEHIALEIGSSLAGLALVLDQWAKRKKVKRNGFALLIEARSLSPSRRVLSF